ncbi:MULTISPECIES: hypothetical protein [Sphingobacterium]|uniref:hypothetical protein n=1 Tax=Sphingobacterium TaxID=28453 RepID=UPI0013DCC7E0|nr:MULTISPECIES: hypothetical protein [unclassified Sphingobacterium]
MQVKLIKYSLLLVWSMLTAYLINISDKILDPMERVADYNFGIVYFVTVLLVIGYIYGISVFYYWLLGSDTIKQKIGNRSATLLYLLSATLSVVFVHRLFLHAGVALASPAPVNFWDELFAPVYWRTDFIFLLIPVLATVLFFYYFPQYSLFKVKEIRVEVLVERAVYIAVEKPVEAPGTVSAGWRAYCLPHMLLADLRLKMDSTIRLGSWCIRLFDIVFIVKENNSYFAVLTNGEKYQINFSKKMLSEWALGAWFIQIERGRYINMLYVRYPISNFLRLELDERVAEVLFHSDNRYNTAMLTVSRRLSEEVKAFLAQIPELEENGWEDAVAEVRV